MPSGGEFFPDALQVRCILSPLSTTLVPVIDISEIGSKPVIYHAKCIPCTEIPILQLFPLVYDLSNLFSINYLIKRQG